MIMIRTRRNDSSSISARVQVTNYLTVTYAHLNPKQRTANWLRRLPAGSWPDASTPPPIYSGVPRRWPQPTRQTQCKKRPSRVACNRWALATEAIAAPQSPWRRARRARCRRRYAWAESTISTVRSAPQRGHMDAPRKRALQTGQEAFGSR